VGRLQHRFTASCIAALERLPLPPKPKERRPVLTRSKIVPLETVASEEEQAKADSSRVSRLARNGEALNGGTRARERAS
jgi:hypothetical protein